ncbi:NodT family RND efflux system outer membrane lipoprotein [Pandoraea communis]|uniref:NodT family RND efflux system outer membrane lipoprotein n=1 Tax=Pandoraea communis TaxID=2508297 RepID=A0A5E4T0Q5_9BURK|nr:efflux transporter outer membrane subunit [Pandoraea communis]VVD81031.1 NodT family RND efflux system outer membrane lipoprotein [Pandoraea communis]
MRVARRARRHYPARSALPWLALGLGATLAACAAGPDFHTPEPTDVARYTTGTELSSTAGTGGAQGAAQTLVAGDDVPSHWWTRFGSPALDALVAQALADSPTLRQAQAKLRQAQEDYRAQAGARLLPSADLKLSGTREQVDLASFGITSVPSPGPFTLYNASVNIAYTLDVFGGNRRVLEGLAAQIDYQRFEAEAARLSLAGNVVTAALRQASARAQLSALEGMASAQRAQLDITRARQRAGGVAPLDVENQAALVAQTEAQLPTLRLQIAQYDHQLARLTGRAPGAFTSPVIDLNGLTLPQTVPVSLPSTLAQRRPDIRASEALLHRASADVGVATANLYPQFTLSGSFGTQRMRTADLGNGINIWSLGMNLLQPLFRGGELHAQRRSALAAYDAALASYQDTVLLGLAQVADAMRALEADAAALIARDDAARRAEAAFRIASERYRVGGISHLSLLDAQRQALDATRARLDAQGARLTDTAALWQALGGATTEPVESRAETYPRD